MGTLRQVTVSEPQRTQSTVVSEPLEHVGGHAYAPEYDPYLTEEWQLACRVAASRFMAKSELLPRFLLHICEMTLRDRKGEITEQRIGILIFNRPAGYNPGEDNIVRSYARTLRKRLDDYFSQEGRHERLRITIPRGGYVAVFSEAPSGVFPLEGAGGPAPAIEIPKPIMPSQMPEEQLKKGLPAAKASLGDMRAVWLAGLLGLLAGAALAAAVWLAWPAKKGEQESAAHQMWQQMFQPNRETLIVPADSGLGILENLSKRSVTVEQYANGSYLDDLTTASIDPGNFADIGRQRYTSVVDLNIVARLSRLPEFVPERTVIRYVRGVTADDVKSSNVILIGSKHTNPWVALFERSMNFSLEYTPNVDESYILNHSPASGERASYRNALAGTSGQTYGVIAYLPGLDGTGHVLIVEGLNMAGTEAAAEVLFYAKLIQPALKRATRPDGSLRPFELLVETSSVGATSPEAHILATRIHED